MKRILHRLRRFNLVSRLVQFAEGMKRQWTGQGVTLERWTRKVLYIGLMACVGFTLAACNKKLPIPASAPESQKSPTLDREYFSDSIVTAEIRGRTYRIPKNYLPMHDWKNYESYGKYKLEYGNFHLFYPNYDGYTRELTALMFSASYNPPRMPTDALAMQHMKNMVLVGSFFPLTLQEIEQPKVDPANEFAKKSWLEMKERSMKVVGSIAEKNMHGLRCLSPSTNSHYFRCHGSTNKGEELYFKCDKTWVTAQLGVCGIAHYSAKENYAVYYDFAQDLLPHWRAVNDAVFAKIKSWEQK